MLTLHQYHTEKHKPLLGLLRECKSTSPQASARVRRYSLYLSQFEYHLTFRRTLAHANADALSRLPLPTELDTQPALPEMVLLFQHLDDSPVIAKQIAEEIRKDSVLSIVECTQGKACLTQLILTLNYDHILTGS